MSPNPPPETRFKRILFCTDFAESAEAAFDFAIDAAIRRPGSTLYLLHVVQEPDALFWKSYIRAAEGVDEEAKRAMDAKMAESYLARVPAGLPVKVEVRVGPDAAVILQFAEEERIDLIVIGRHIHSGIENAIFGGVVEKIVRKAKCAVLVVPLEYARA
jgi:nucleotide-binding universal stress UspA family protein